MSSTTEPKEGTGRKMKTSRKHGGTKKAINSNNNQLQIRKPSPLAFIFPKMPRLSIFKKKGKKPNELEVTTDQTNIQYNDGISVITPLTGLPPEDHPGRLHALGMAPPQVNGAALYDIACNSNDEMSAITSGVPSPEKKSTDKKISVGLTTEMVAKKPPPALPGDDDSEDIMVYEDGTVESGQSSLRSPVHIIGELSSSRRNITIEKNNTQDKKKLSDTIQKNSSWLTRSKYFEKLVEASFDMVDADKSGDITLDEMYAGLLLIHLKLAVYVGAPACRVSIVLSAECSSVLFLHSLDPNVNVYLMLKPASREYVSEIFHLLKSDDDDTLNREEFAVVMKILYSQVLTRIVIQWTLTLMSE